MPGALSGPGGRQVEIGQRLGGLVAVLHENRAESAGLGAPGDGDAVTGGLTDAMQFLGDGGCGVGSGRGERVGDGQPRGQRGFDPDVVDHPGLRNVGDADNGGAPRRQLVAQSGAVGAVGPRPGGRGGDRPHRRGRLVDEDVVAVAVQLVVGQSALELDVESGRRGAGVGPVGEKLRRQKQFGFTEHGVADALPDLGRIGAAAAGQGDAGLEGALQGVVADVADEQRPAGGEQLQGVVDDVGEIPGVGEVLDDRVDDDGVEAARRQPVGDVGGLGQQLDPVTPGQLQLFHRSGQVVDRHRGEVGGDIAVAPRGDLGQQQPRARADLQHAPRPQRHDAIDCGGTPFGHFLQRDRLAGVAAVPAAEVLAERRGEVGAVQVVIEVLPLRDVVGVVGVVADVRVARPVIECHVGDQLGAGGAVLHGDGRLGDLRAAQQGVLDFAQLDALPAQLDLVVGAAEVVQRPLGRPAHQVAGAVHALTRAAKGVGHEPFRGQVHPAEIAVAQRRPAQIQLAHHADRDGLQPAVQHPGAHAGDRGADAHRLARRQPCAGDPDGGLAGAVAVEHLPARRPAVDQLGQAGLPDGDQGVQPVEPAVVERRDHGGGQDGRADPLVVQQRGQRLTGVYLRRRHDQRRPGSRGQQQFPDGRVEGRGGDHQHPRVRTQAEQLALGRGPAQQAGVADRDALGDTGGTRREDQIRGVVGAQRGAPVGVGDRLGGVAGQVETVDPQDRPRPRAGDFVRAAGQYAHRVHRVQHRGDPLDRVVQIHRRVHAAGLGHRPPGDHQLGAPLDRHPDRVLGAHTVLDQLARQAC
ncbi:hypothetical protein MAHJHV58_10180 [Mycobacterium avium subsp. hominissuis]